MTYVPTKEQIADILSNVFLNKVLTVFSTSWI